MWNKWETNDHNTKSNFHWWKYQSYDHIIHWTKSWISTNAFKGQTQGKPTPAARRLTVPFQIPNQIHTLPSRRKKGGLVLSFSPKPKQWALPFLSPLPENQLPLFSPLSFLSPEPNLFSQHQPREEEKKTSAKLSLSPFELS